MAEDLKNTGKGNLFVIFGENCRANRQGRNYDNEENSFHGLLSHIQMAGCLIPVPVDATG
jgi:hypothetical protein